MTAVFGAVLLCAYGLERIASPLGDAGFRAVDSRPIELTGTVVAQPFDSSLVLNSAGTIYLLSGPDGVRRYVGRIVRVSGTLHQSTGRIEVNRIDENYHR
ncbi:MAG: DUF5818 domain-containing protein [Candidatus Sulfopaludibacter sp.]|nr:DUF5818 domain-containing protein [Candidatus Sulfopaludibacter sp.]